MPCSILGGLGREVETDIFCGALGLDDIGRELKGRVGSMVDIGGWDLRL
jgi:hypothetical protein